MKDAPLKFMTFDIECLPDNGSMPRAETSPIILMSMAFNPPYRGQKDIVLIGKQVNCIRKDTISCNSEIEMLQQFASIVRDYDPDIMAGYNSNGFDWPYIIDRAQKIHTTLRLGRDGGPCYYRKIITNTNISMVGRVIVDLLPIIRSSVAYNLKQYTLRNVAHELLKIEKYDVDPKEIETLWKDDETGLKRFISYARRDAVLVMNLLTELKLMDKYIALSKASGVLLQDIINGGQSGMIESLLMRRFKAIDRVVLQKPSSHNEEETDSLKGAIVLTPKKGIVPDIVWLDYKSLYPTIMMAHNLCYTTVVVDEQPEDIFVSPVGGKFVKKEVCEGIVPQILKELLDERIRTKKLMKTSPESERATLDAKQYAMKILLNSFYGYSGYVRARLYSMDVAAAVTSIGRENIERTRDMINGMEFPLNAHRAEVVYGDTDSVAVHITPEIDLPTAKIIGSMIAKRVTKSLPQPMELVFEAFAKRALFIAKKRYALWRFEESPTSPSGWKDKIKVVGMETVRRDWCKLTGRTLNHVLELILKEGRTTDAVVHVQGVIEQLRKMEVPIEDITLTRKYTKGTGSYKSKQPHVQLVEKIKARGEEAPVIGDRVEFIIVTGKKRKGHNTELFVDRAEDPKYAAEHGMVIDKDYYINKQILPPVMRIFEALGITQDVVTEEKKQKTLWEF